MATIQELLGNLKTAARSGNRNAGSQYDVLSDISSGLEQADKEIPEGKLGRLGETEEIKSSLGTLEEQTKGDTAEIIKQREEKTFQNLNQQSAEAARLMQRNLAKSGVRGNIAGRKLLDLTGNVLSGRTEQAQQALDTQFSAIQSGTRDLTNLLTQVRQFDIGQIEAEQNARIAYIQGLMSTAASERLGQADQRRSELENIETRIRNIDYLLG